MDFKIYPNKKQDDLGKHKAMHRASGKQGATLWIAEFQAHPSQQFNSRMNKDNLQFSMLIEKFESHQHKEQFLKGMSQTQKMNRFSEASQKLLQDWNRQRSSNFARILQNFNVLTAIPLRKSGLFIPVAGVIWVQAESYNISKGQLRFQFDPWLHH